MMSIDTSFNFSKQKNKLKGKKGSQRSKKEDCYWGHPPIGDLLVIGGGFPYSFHLPFHPRSCYEIYDYLGTTATD